MSQQHLIDPGDAKTKIGLKSSTPVILIFGTIKPNKRLDWAIEAMIKISQNYPDAKLVIAGKPREQDVSKYVELAGQLGVASNVVWRLGYVTDQELIWYFSAADVVVFPYQWIYQSAALVMAMSFAKPIIATATGSNFEFIKNNETGSLVPLNDSVAIANAILAVLDDPQYARAMGKAAYEYVTTKMSWDKIAGSTLEFYYQSIQLFSRK